MQLPTQSASVVELQKRHWKVSRVLRFPAVREFYLRRVRWSPRCFAAACGGAPLDGRKFYIAQQARNSSPY